MDAPDLHVIEIGVGDADAGTVVFLHGLFGQGRNFTQIARGLTPELGSLLVDLPNHGRSPWSDTEDYVAQADAVAAWLRASRADATPVHVVGHSMGGKVAMLLALRHPDLVRRLVVVDIAPSNSDGAGEFEHLLSALAALDLSAVHRRQDADDALQGPIPDPRVRGFLLQNLRATGTDPGSGEPAFAWQANLELLRRELPTIGGFPTVSTHFDHPVLWMAGADSRYILPEHRAEMLRLFPQTTRLTVKGAGHWVHADQPATVITALRTFLLADHEE